MPMGSMLPTPATFTKRAQYSKTSANSAAGLIVEDEALIRMNAVQMVEDAGYVALEASNADDAIAILKSRRDIGAVFTDVNMSGSTSRLKLAHAIRHRWPPIHAKRGITSRYATAPDPALVAAADRICGTLANVLDGKTKLDNVVPIGASPAR
jgi:CheY-like chemotaxis protein